MPTLVTVAPYGNFGKHQDDELWLELLCELLLELLCELLLKPLVELDDNELLDDAELLVDDNELTLLDVLDSELLVDEDDNEDEEYNDPELIALHHSVHHCDPNQSTNRSCYGS
jgi:hypothetical protein